MKIKDPTSGALPVFSILVVALVILTFIANCKGQVTFDGCGPHGNSKPGTVEYAGNPFKNRFDSNSAVLTHLNKKITVQSILVPGNNQSRFSNNDAVRITLYVVLVKPGGVESCECNNPNPDDLDSHIVAVVNPKDAKTPSHHFIIEVTPRIRAMMKAKGIDWSTKTLNKTLSGHWVQFTGYMFYDKIHEPSAEQIHPGKKANWRFTCWELGHPVTAIEIVK
jgi:hypothetical protein